MQYDDVMVYDYGPTQKIYYVITDNHVWFPCTILKSKGNRVFYRQATEHTAKYYNQLNIKPYAWIGKFEVLDTPPTHLRTLADQEEYLNLRASPKMKLYIRGAGGRGVRSFSYYIPPSPKKRTRRYQTDLIHEETDDGLGLYHAYHGRFQIMVTKLYSQGRKRWLDNLLLTMVVTCDDGEISTDGYLDTLSADLNLTSGRKKFRVVISPLSLDALTKQAVQRSILNPVESHIFAFFEAPIFQIEFEMYVEREILF